MLSTTTDAREQYDARNYGAVVKLLSQLPRETLIAQPEHGFMLADAARRVGGYDDLLDLAGEVVESARKQRADRVLCDALNLQGVLLLEAGYALAAERAWCDLVIVASRADNSEFVARASNNLGVAAILSMRLEDAISAFNRAVTAYLRLGYARGLAQSHQNLGIVFRELEHEKEAFTNFERAMTWAYTADCMDDVARAEQELALLLVYSGKELASAASAARHALDRFTELEQPAGRAEALRVIGVIEVAGGDAAAAAKTLNEAMEIAQSCGLRLLEGEILLAQAVIQEPARRQVMLNQAERIFSDIGAKAWGGQVRRRMESL